MDALIQSLDLKRTPEIEMLLEGKINLPAWSSYQITQGAYNSSDQNVSSKAIFKIIIDSQTESGPISILESQVAAIKYLQNNDERIKDVVIDSLFDIFPNLSNYGEPLPEIENKAYFKDHIHLSNVLPLDAEKDGVAYIGLEFECTWEEEHGLGIMIHKDKVVDIGDAVSASDIWTAFKDNGTYEQEQQKWRERNPEFAKRIQEYEAKMKQEQNIVNPLTFVKPKPWWKFW